METPPTLLIPDRLIGIPLVSGGRHDKLVVSSSSSSKKPLADMLRPIQVEKREVIEVPQNHTQVTQPIGLLFKPSHMTASTANIIKAKTTTTKRPLTTRRSKAPKFKPVKMVATRKPAPQAQNEPRIMNETTTTSTTRKPQSTTQKSVNTEESSATEPTSRVNISHQENRNHQNMPVLTKAIQTFTNQPGSQRRTSQTITSPRFASKLDESRNGYAGENWTLFNRTDGHMSLFETLALVSNIMIVSTIVLFTFLNWMKSLKKKRSLQSQLNQLPRPSTSPAVSDTRNSRLSADEVSGRGSKISVISSGVNSHSIMASASEASERIVAKTKENRDFSTNQVSASDRIEDRNQLNDQGAQPRSSQQVGPAQNISSEIMGGVNVTNKAMAIVQPTENNTNSSTLSDSEKPLGSIAKHIGDQIKNTINRSVSDLSSEPKPKPKQPKTSKDAEQINLSMPSTSSKAKVEEKDTKKKHSDNCSQLSVSSLESIELPEALVESINLSEPRNLIEDDAPSPNLLLGEIELPEKSLVTNIPTDIENQNLSGEEKAQANQVKIEVVREKEESKEATNSAMEISETVLEKEKEPDSKKVSAKQASTKKANERPKNPMAIEMANKKASKKSDENSIQDIQSAKVKNHQIVVNKLDRRKTNLEIVDIRDESVTSKMRNNAARSTGEDDKIIDDESVGWISMDGVAVVQQAGSVPTTGNQANTAQQGQAMSPSEIIENRFHVDYAGKRRKAQLQRGTNSSKDSTDSKAGENIENELEQDNKMKNRKYFVYIVHDGHFTAKKDCIARIELPQKRRTTLAELRQLIANSQDISLSSLRRNRFKFVTETYRLLNENEDAAVLHQVYPTQGVFLKLNIPEQENQIYPYKSRARLSSSSTGPVSSSLAQATIASRRRANTSRVGRTDSGLLPAIEVDYAQNEPVELMYGRTRASSVGRSRPNRKSVSQSVYGRSKSSLQGGRHAKQPLDEEDLDKLPAIGRLIEGASTVQKKQAPGKKVKQPPGSSGSINVLSGAKRLFNATFHR